MKGLENKLVSLADIREIDLAGCLEKLGYEPAKIKKNGTDYWYLSPLRNEREASFHVNRLSNEWYDFPLAAGGGPVEFFLRFYGCSVPELLEKFGGGSSYGELPKYDPALHEGRLHDEHKLLVREVFPLYSYPLKNYLHERSIPVAVAEQYCSEVHYEINGRSFYGIGFQNDAGGWEIRNKNYKQSGAPKEITTLDFGAREAEVFEGSFDFLSYQTLHPYVEPGTADFVVLNGAGMFDRALPFLERHESVRLWLDQDLTGRAYTQYALSLGARYRDESGLYSRHNDLNDWLVHKGEFKKVRLKPQNRLLSGG
ncbi:toprim domain-containing protein [Mucilaginibacter sp. McL0603]|uniref:toprim domain-containing protein n=1 Tax=Mucilaginibacter sp. McL0603 TaxID=3415670 RepID=UPI003CF8249C